jgi:hypothetical protein
MSLESESARSRRYLLGKASEDECSAIEREYFGDEDAVDRMAAAEDDLIEDYLTDRLGTVERRRFEQAYLSNAHRRRRVETLRALMAAAAAEGSSARAASVARTGDVADRSPRVTHVARWLSGAAALFVLAGALWLFLPSHREQRQSGNRPSAMPVPTPERAAPAPQAAPPSSSRIYTVSISPVAVRSASDRSTVVVPRDTDVVVLQLQDETRGKALVSGSASIRTVSGRGVWLGPVSDGDPPAGVIARIDVPAALLAVDDYIIVLLEAGPGRGERERAQYFLRVRAR